MQIAGYLGVDMAAAERRWTRNNARLPNARSRIAGGGPPSGLRTYQDFQQALRELLKVRGVSQRELTRRDPGCLDRPSALSCAGSDLRARAW